METRSFNSLFNHYNEISDYCNKTGKPILLTKNGNTDLIVLSLEAYEKKEQLLNLKEKLLKNEISRLKGAKDYTPEELDEEMKKVLNI